MLNFIRSLFGGGSYLGIDIGTISIKLVELSRHGSLFRLENYGFLESYGHLERLNNALQTSTLRMMDREIAEMLKLLIKTSKVRTKNAVVSIPSFLAFITLLELPEMSQEEVGKAIPFQARQYVPLPISEVAIDWLKVGEKEDEQGNKKQLILLVAVPTEQIRKYQGICKAAGLNLLALEVESLSLARVLTAGDPTPTVLVDIGGRSTNIAVVDQGLLKFNSQIDFGGGDFTGALATGLNINPRRAEELKKTRGLLGTGGEYELSTLMAPLLDAIISEVRRAKDSYERNYNRKIERVMLAGGSANLLGIEKYFKDQLGVPVIKANPFSKVVYPKHLGGLVDDLGPPLSVALGLGIREIK